jgi:hypothetical protein
MEGRPGQGSTDSRLCNGHCQRDDALPFYVSKSDKFGSGTDHATPRWLGGAPQQTEFLHNTKSGLRITQWNNELSYVSDEFIAWPHPECSKIEKSILNLDNIRFWEVPKIKDQYLYAHLIRLKESLIWWEDSTPRRCISSTLLVVRNLAEGPSFAEEMADAIKYTYRQRMSTCAMYSEMWDAHIDETAWGIDYFFPPCHLIPWKIPDQGDIYLSLKDPPLVDNDLRTLFKNKVRECILDDVDDLFKKFDDLDKLQLLGGTKVWDGKSTRNKTRTETMFDKPNFSIGNKMRFKYAYVQKTAAEARAAVVCDQETLNLLRALKISLEQVRNCKSDVFNIRDFSFLEEWLSDPNSMYLMSDQSKCGLTFPPNLIEDVLIVLDETYPNSIFKIGLEGFRNREIFIDGERYAQHLGPNLGMMNEYVSFAMGCLVELFRDQIGQQDFVAMMYNDDQILRYPRERATASSMMDIGESWDNFMIQYGCTVHEKKPFWSRNGCFLETFGYKDNKKFKCRKDNQVVLNLFWSLLCVNITHAKEYVASCFDQFDEVQRKMAEPALCSIVSLFGNEFLDKERLFSYPIGWVRKRNEDGLNMILEDILTYDGSDIRDLKLANTLLARKPVKYNKRIKDKAMSLIKSKAMPILELPHEVDSSFEKLKKTVISPYLGIKYNEKADVYRSWKLERYKLFKESRVDPMEILDRRFDLFTNAFIPYELRRRYKSKLDIPVSGNIKYVYQEEGDKPHLRQLLKCHQNGGKFKDVELRGKLRETDYVNCSKYYNCIHPDAAKIIKLQSETSRTEVIKVLEVMEEGIVSLSHVPPADLSQVIPWAYGKGDCVYFSEIFQMPLRFNWKDYELAFYKSKSEHTIELACMLSLVDEYEIKNDLLNSPFQIDEILGGVRRSTELDPADSQASDHGETGAREAYLSYVQHMMSGVYDQAAAQLDHEDRINAQANAVIYGGDDEPDIFGGSDDGSEGGLLFGSDGGWG